MSPSHLFYFLLNFKFNQSICIYLNLYEYVVSHRLLRYEEMKRRSISDQCLASEAIEKLRQREQQQTAAGLGSSSFMSRAKSEIDCGSVQTLNGRGHSASRALSRIFRLKNKHGNQLDTSPSKIEPRRNSILFQTTTLIDYDNYQDLNAKIDVIKQSMMDNLNKLKERDVSIQDLEQKADYLNQHALNLNMVSTNIKKQQKSIFRSNVKRRILGIMIVFFGLCSVCSYFIYFKISNA